MDKRTEEIFVNLVFAGGGFLLETHSPEQLELLAFQIRTLEYLEERGAIPNAE